MIDPVWEAKYQQGYNQKYPWDSVVSFVHQYAAKNKNRAEINLLEVGFGTGSNLWFAAREGFNVSGIEGSASAVTSANNRFGLDSLKADLRQGDFTELPFSKGCFDMVIDRAALTHVGIDEIRSALAEIYRVLKPEGILFFNPYADTHTSHFHGRQLSDGRITDINKGTLQGVGGVQFISRSDINSLFGKGWRLEKVQRKEIIDMLDKATNIHAEWIVVAKKIYG